MDEQRERPDHGDEDDIFVGIVQQKGRCEEEHYRSDSEKDEQGDFFFHPSHEFLQFCVFHVTDIN